MRRLLAALVVFGVVPAPARAFAPHVAGEILVRFEPHIEAAAREATLHGVSVDRIEALGSTGVFCVHLAGISTATAVAQLAARPGVAYVEPNFVLAVEPVEPAAIPNDPMFAQQWALDNTGQTGGTPGADVDAVRAWDLATGNDGVVVALIDTGLDFAHPDLAPQAWTNPGEIPANGIDDDANGFIDDVRGWDFVNGDADPADDQGHGTFLAGSMGAVGNNAVGITGVAWTLRIAPVKSLNASGSGTTAQAILAVDYATRIGADVILAGWGGGAFSQALHDVIAAAGVAGIPFVTPAGASGGNIDVSPVYPASYALANVLAVAATDANDGLASFSSWGPMTVDLGAPGVGIVTTVLGGSYATISGTATAAAHVAGGLALLADRFPSLDGAAAVEHLVAHVDVVPALVGRVRSDGRLNVYLPLATSPTDAAEIGAPALRAWWIPSGGKMARIGFTLPSDHDVRLEIFDVRGRRVRQAHLAPLSAGTHTWDWDGRNTHGASLGRGIYWVRLHAQASVAIRIQLVN